MLQVTGSSRSWRLELELPRARQALHFPLPLSEPRRAFWRPRSTPTSPRTRWEHREGRTSLAADHPFDRVVLEAPRPLPSPESDPVPLPDRPGLGFLDLGPFLPATSAEDPELLPLRVEIRTDPETWILAGGRQAQGHVSLAPREAAILDSTPVLLSGEELPDYGEFQLWVAPGAPNWIGRVTHAYLPRIMDFFSRLTGGPISWRPVVLVQHRPSGDAERFDVYPGGQGAVLELTLEGGGWEIETPEIVLDWIWSLSHHAFHLWNQEAFRTRDPAGDQWLSEGMAEYATLLALFEVNLVTEADWHRYLEDFVERCAARSPLPLQETRGDPASDCGTSALLAAHGILYQHRGEEYGPAHLFTGILDRAQGRDYDYSAEDLLAILEELTAAPSEVELLRRWIREPLRGGLREALGELLERAGFPRLGTPPEEGAPPEEGIQPEPDPQSDSSPQEAR